jgi:acyl-CoA thioester hydrolase
MSRPRTLLEFLRSVPVVARVPMRWGDMDAFKHLNNCVYFQYQEQARLRYMQAMISKIRQLSDKERDGFNIPAFLNGTGYGPIMASTSCRYLFPATYPDIILMGGKAVERDESHFTLQHRSWSLRHGRVISEGEAKIVSLDYVKGVRADIHPAMLLAMDMLEKENCEHLYEQFETTLTNKKFEE